MHTGRNYSAVEVLLWTRTELLALGLLAALPTAAYVLLGWKWLTLPWLPIALLGTAVAFVVGFKNNASYDRLWEARRVYGAIVNQSRVLAIMVKDYVTTRRATPAVDADFVRAEQLRLLHRHFAWLTALRYQLREPRSWEATHRKYNVEYRDKWFTIDEQPGKLEGALAPYLHDDERARVMATSNKAAQLIALQSSHLRALLEAGLIEDFRHMELQRVLAELYNQQGAAERLKNFPYPRQYATINLWFIRLFVVLLPLGMLQEFEKLGGELVWLTVPFSVLSGWVFTTMEKIGEASECPFEGSANDVPITALSRAIEIDLREMMNDGPIPPPLQATHHILS